MKERDISDTGTRKIQEDVKEFLKFVPQHKVFEIVLDYLSNDKEVKEFVVYIQSEEFPKIHKMVEYLKEYKEVSAFMCMFLKPLSDRESICSVSNVV
jgi:hypothetical protein